MELVQIAEKIIKNNPTSCIAYNYFQGMHKEHLIRELMDFFCYEVLNLCGCGLPEYTQETIRRYLNIKFDLHEHRIGYQEAKERYATELKVDCDDAVQYGMFQFMMYGLDHCGLTEHGSGIGGAWLTELGEMYLTVLNAWADLDSTKQELGKLYRGNKV